MVNRRRCLGWLAATAGTQAGAAPEARVPLLVADSTWEVRDYWVQASVLVARHAGLQWDLERLPWPRALEKALAGGGILLGAAHNAEREAVLAYSQPIVQVYPRLLVREADAPELNTWQDLNGQSICVSRGVYYGDAFHRLPLRRSRLLVSDRGLAGKLRMLLAGRCAAAVVITESETADATAFARGLRMPLEGVRLLPLRLPPHGLGFAARRGSEWAAYLPRLDAALKAAQTELLHLQRE